MPEPLPEKAPIIPASAPALLREPEIHVMPEKYMGVTLKAALPPAPPPIPPPSAPRPPAKLPPPLAPAAVKPTGPAKGLIVAVIVIVALALTVAGVFFYPRKKPAPPPTAPPPVVNLPANLPPSPPPAAPVTTTPAAATTTPEFPPVSAAPALAPDSDADGLSDTEEEEIYGTKLVEADSDGDGYLDGGEVFYLYNPAGVAPVTLKDSGLVASLEFPALGFSVLAPTRWLIKEIENGVVLSGTLGESVQITRQTNPLNLPLGDWYRANSAEAARQTLLSFQTRTGLSGLRTEDGLSTYLGSGESVIALIYIPSEERRISYKRTYEMIANSFRFIAVVPPAAGASATGTAATTTP